MSFDGASAVGLRFDIGEPEVLEARGHVIFRYCDSAGGPIAPRRSATIDVRVDPSRSESCPVPSPLAPRGRARSRVRRFGRRHSQGLPSP